VPRGQVQPAETGWVAPHATKQAFARFSSTWAMVADQSGPMRYTIRFLNKDASSWMDAGHTVPAREARLSTNCRFAFNAKLGSHSNQLLADMSVVDIGTSNAPKSELCRYPIAQV